MQCTKIIALSLFTQAFPKHTPPRPPPPSVVHSIPKPFGPIVGGSHIVCTESRACEQGCAILDYWVNSGLNDELPWVLFYHDTMRREHEINTESGHLKTLEVIAGPRLCIRDAPCNALLLEGS